VQNNAQEKQQNFQA